jgi:hypothetical protein
MHRATHILGIVISSLLLLSAASAQDAATGALRGTVVDPHGARIPAAEIVVLSTATGRRYSVTTDSEGRFALDLLPPGDYSARAVAPGMSPQITPQLRVELGAAIEIEFRLAIAGAQENITVSGDPQLVETQPSAVSTILDERALQDLPLNGRRFSDLMLLSPGVTQDPRSLTSTNSGDLAFGGIRGFQNSFLVDGGDNNNGFFAQALGRYRAPYQFSTEVVQEFRVSSNSYGAELGRAGGAVVNVVTKSGSNHFHGTGFYFVRDASFGSTDPFMTFKPPSRQQQFGGTIGGPLKKNKVFFFAGFDQHIIHAPTVVEFLNGSSVVVPQPPDGAAANDYEASDQALVFQKAAELDSLAGTFAAAQIGNAGFGKLDIHLSPRNELNLRFNNSRYWGANNVFLDPASPITYDANSDNGTETVATETGSLALTTSFTPRLISHLRAQFSRDLQQSYSNPPPLIDHATVTTLLKLPGIIDGIGRSDLLPRATRQHRAQMAETLSFDTSRYSFKFGGDSLRTWVYDFFPSQQSGEYLFYPINVDPASFDPCAPSCPLRKSASVTLTPLRAYAHGVPHYYLQNFGSAVSHPDSNDYAAFAQDTIRVTDHLAVNLGVRWDLQTFSTAGLISNPLFPPSGKVPFKPFNFAPRAGFAYSIGNTRPLVVRAGYGIFYVRIPEIYSSVVATDNGITDSQVFLNNDQFADNQAFPVYPNPLVSCPLTAASCPLPPGFTQGVTHDVSAFATNFVTPRVQQASLTLEKEVAERTTVSVSYLYVHGEHLIRALDVNLPPPAPLIYPILSVTDSSTAVGYYIVDSFATIQSTPSQTCPFTPCINPLARLYNGATLSINRRMARGAYLRLSYTYARAIDDGQDALVAGQPATVQNSYNPTAERGPSVTDQRSRVSAAISIDPRPFHRGHELLGHLFNDWKLSSIFTYGSGRPVNATVGGDPNQDGNYDNDRLPGYSRNAFTGPDYATTDLRLTRILHLGERFKLNLIIESFNLLNRTNAQVMVTSNGLITNATTFVQTTVTAGSQTYPAYYQQPQNFLKPNSAYAPRQVQLGLKFIY